MATRDNEPVLLTWLHLDASHPEYSGVVSALRAAHEGGSDLRLSVNVRADGSQSLVKVMGPVPALTPAQRSCVVRSYGEADHGEAAALVATRATDDGPSELAQKWVAFSEGRP